MRTLAPNQGGGSVGQPNFEAPQFAFRVSIAQMSRFAKPMPVAVKVTAIEGVHCEMLRS